MFTLNLISSQRNKGTALFLVIPVLLITTYDYLYKADKRLAGPRPQAPITELTEQGKRTTVIPCVPSQPPVFLTPGPRELVVAFVFDEAKACACVQE